MRAVVRDVYGPPEVLRLEEVEKPAPKGDEVLIRVHAVSLNASDWEILTGNPLYGRIWGFFTPKVRVLGSDVAGTVEAVGPDVTEFQPGDAVRMSRSPVPECKLRFPSTVPAGVRRCYLREVVVVIQSSLNAGQRSGTP